MVICKNYKFSDFVTINPLVSLKPNQEYSFIEMKDLKDGQRFAYPSIERKLTGGARFEEEDTLFARITPCLENGKICQAKGLNNRMGFGSTEFLVFRGKKNISKNDFVYYLSRWDEVRRFAELNMVGTSGRQRVPKDVFNNLELLLPDINTQNRIASILSSLDDKIELNRRMNQTLEQMAQALFNHYFVDNIDVDNLPEGWKKGKLEKMVNIKGGTTPSTKEPKFWNGNIHWTTPKDFSSLSFPVLLNTEKKITEAGLKKISSGLLPVGTLLLSSRAPIGYLAISQIPVAINQGFIAIECNKGYSNIFMLYWLKKNMDLLIRNANGSTFLEISKSVFRNIDVLIPESKMAEKYTRLLSPIFSQIVQNEKENITLKVIRDTLLPKLMSGEINVSELNEKKLKENYVTENILNA